MIRFIGRIGYPINKVGELPLDQRIRKSPMLNTMAPSTGGAETKRPGLCGSSTSRPPSLSSGSWKSNVHVPKSLKKKTQAPNGGKGETTYGMSANPSLGSTYKYLNRRAWIM